MSQMHSASRSPQKLWPLLGGLLAIAVVTYLSSYIMHYRRGVADADSFGLPDTFLYVPVESVMQSHDLTFHYRRKKFYKPLNWIHYQWFGGRPACSGILFDLS